MNNDGCKVLQKNIMKKNINKRNNRDNCWSLAIDWSSNCFAVARNSQKSWLNLLSVCNNQKKRLKLRVKCSYLLVSVPLITIFFFLVVRTNRFAMFGRVLHNNLFFFLFDNPTHNVKHNKFQSFYKWRKFPYHVYSSIWICTMPMGTL